MVNGRPSFPQEAFSGFGNVAVVMVTAMFVFGAAMVRTGTDEMIGGRLFRACAHDELLFQVAVLSVACRPGFRWLCDLFLSGWAEILPKAEVQSLEQELGKEYLTEVMVTPQSTTVGLTLDPLDCAKRQDVTIVGVIRKGERMPPNGWKNCIPATRSSYKVPCRQKAAS
jgi:hypothetical protein